MLLYVFLVLGVWEGVIGSGDSCEEMCPTPFWSFPKSEADIDQMCPQIARVLDCEKDYSDKCGLYDELAEERFQKMRSLVEDACRKDSPLHLGIVQNIGCFNEVFKGDLKICYWYSRSNTSAMKEYIQNIEVEERFEGYTRKDELWTSFSCLRDSLQMACLVSKASDRCGSDVQDIAFEVLTRAHITYRTCSAASEEIQEELLSHLNMGLEEEASLKRFLRKE